MVFVEVIEFTINHFGTLNEATKSIRIIPIVVFKDKAWHSHFTCLGRNVVLLVALLHHLTFDLTAFWVKAVFFTIDDTFSCHSVTMFIKVVPSLVFFILNKGIYSHITSIRDEVTDTAIWEANKLVFSLDTCLCIKVEGCTTHFNETSSHVTITVEIADILTITCKIVETVDSFHTIFIVVISVAIATFNKWVTSLKTIFKEVISLTIDNLFAFDLLTILIIIIPLIFTYTDKWRLGIVWINTWFSLTCDDLVTWVILLVTLWNDSNISIWTIRMPYWYVWKQFIRIRNDSNIRRSSWSRDGNRRISTTIPMNAVWVRRTRRNCRKTASWRWWWPWWWRRVRIPSWTWWAWRTWRTSTYWCWAATWLVSRTRLWWIRVLCSYDLRRLWRTDLTRSATYHSLWWASCWGRWWRLVAWVCLTAIVRWHCWQMASIFRQGWWVTFINQWSTWLNACICLFKTVTIRKRHFICLCRLVR